MTTLSIPKTSNKIYSHQELLKHFFSQNIPTDEAFIQLPGENFYRLVEEAWEDSLLDRLMSKKMIKDYVVFDHVLLAISEIPDFLTPKQCLQISDFWYQNQ